MDGTPGVLRPLLTANERRAEPVLRAVAGRHGYRVDTQVKLSHLLSTRPPGVTDEQWRYAKMAELDFLVSDDETTLPEFAVELDDRSHRTVEVRSRDAMKDAVCTAAGLELLRVEGSAFRRGPRGRVLVDYLIDARSYLSAFDDAQEAGYVPYDEPGDYRSVIDLAGGGGLDFVNDLAMPARSAAFTAYDAGLVSSQIISVTSVHRVDGWVEAFAWLAASPGMYLLQRARLRSYRLACGIGPTGLAEDIAVAALGDDLDGLGRGEPVLRRAADVAAAFAKAAEEAAEGLSLALFKQAVGTWAGGRPRASTKGSPC